MRNICDNVSRSIRALLCLVFLTAAPLLASAQSTAFTYHGQLAEHGQSANGEFDFLFTVFPSETLSSPLRPSLQVNNHTVTKGSFVVVLDFGAGVFDGSDRWIEVAVRRSHPLKGYVTLRPRQKITATPYALYANRAGNISPDALIQADNPGNRFRGTFIGDGSGLTNLPIDAGPVGPAGPMGDTGPQGVQGPVGMTGPQGPIGLTGPQGPQGVQGLVGPKGDKGDVGATGPQGVTGPAGPQGPQGVQGPQGARGLTFLGSWSSTTSYVLDDAVSHNGSAWLAKRASLNIAPIEGDDWTLLAMKGDAGATGPQGVTGPAGPQGPQGPQGVQGPAGPTNADEITSGTLPDARLSSNIVRQSELTSVSDALVMRLIATNNALVARIEALNADHMMRLNAVSNFARTNIPVGVVVASSKSNDPKYTNQGMISIHSVDEESWTNGTATGQPSARSGHSSICTGSEFLVWGGLLNGGQYSANGGRYDPGLDQWTATSPINAPTARTDHTSVWTGQQMIVWGGFGSAGYLGSGGRYSPSTSQWNSLASFGAPSARRGHIAVWNGTHMVVWGGQNAFGLLNDGAVYSPATDTWSAIPSLNAPSSRRGARAVWTGAELIVWGGEGTSGLLADGMKLTFDGAGLPVAWQPISQTGAPSARNGHSMVWTGSHLLVWGGGRSATPESDGYAYDPVADTWTALANTGAPTARTEHAAVWNGSEMFIWGGLNASSSLADGAAYNPATQTWRDLSETGAPIARSHIGAAWSGTELILFGGLSGNTPVSSLQRLDPRAAVHLFSKP